MRSLVCTFVVRVQYSQMFARRGPFIRQKGNYQQRVLESRTLALTDASSKDSHQIALPTSRSGVVALLMPDYLRINPKPTCT